MSNHNVLPAFVLDLECKLPAGLSCLLRIMTKLLLMACALLEAGAGVALLVKPAVTVSLLAGARLDSSGGLVVARIAGAALLSLAIACWQTRNGELGSAATSLVSAMLLYNAATAAILVY